MRIWPARHAVAIWLIAVTAPSHAQCEYDRVLIPAPNCGFFGEPGSLRGVDINESGEIVGDIGCVAGRLAYRWSEANGLEPLNLGAEVDSSWATGINDAGMITGYFESDGADLVSGFIFDSGRVETIPPPTGGNRLRPTGIAESGTTFGHWVNDITGPGLAAFIRRGDELDTLDGVIDATSSEVTGVNSQGVYVGWQEVEQGFDEREAFVLDGRTLSTLGPLPDGINSHAEAINDTGVVVGWGLRNPAMRRTVAAIWDGHTPIVVEPLSGNERSAALDINRFDQVVGESWSGSSPRGFLWHNGRVHDLNDLLAVKTTARITGAWAINDRGLITGHASPGSGTVAFVMSPRLTSDADITIDCVVNTHDLGYLLDHWGTLDPHADLNEDGTVGFADLVLLLGQWG